MPVSSMRDGNTRKEIKRLETEIRRGDKKQQERREKLTKARADLSFPCAACERESPLKEWILIEVQYYYNGYDGHHGYSGWVFSEYNTICPKCGCRNRLLHEDFRSGSKGHLLEKMVSARECLKSSSGGSRINGGFIGDDYVDKKYPDWQNNYTPAPY